MSEKTNKPQASVPSASLNPDLAEAERLLLEQLDQPGKNSGDVLWQLARLYNATKRHDQALHCLRRILAVESDLERKASCVLALGQTMEQCNDFPAAIRFYREAMALEPAFTDTWYFIHNNLGYSYNQVRQFDQGEKCCRFAIQINPHRPNGHKNLGIALAAQGRYQEAAASYVTATFSNAGDARSFMLLEKLLGEHPEFAFDFQSQLDSCAKRVGFAAVASQRAHAGRPFSVLLGLLPSEWVNLCGHTLNAISGGSVRIQVAEAVSQVIEAAENTHFDLAFLPVSNLAMGSRGNITTDSSEQTFRAIKQMKGRKTMGLVLVGTADELAKYSAQGGGVDAILESNQETDALVETIIGLLTRLRS
jgi:tetratricopeptide (TPR) repeat protein